MRNGGCRNEPGMTGKGRRFVFWLDRDFDRRSGDPHTRTRSPADAGAQLNTIALGTLDPRLRGGTAMGRDLLPHDDGAA
ncbi:hypothetical protein HMP09_3005 [Sphingomonas sp. HMP9]|nr:hypothetical protein HMP09_3005 [Sphingomonas sp. HMP9]